MQEKNFFEKVIYLMADDAKKIPRLVVFVLSLSVLDLAGITLIAPYLSVIVEPEQSFKNYKDYDFIVQNFQTSEELMIFFSLILLFIFGLKTIGGIFLNKMIISFCYNQGIKLRTFLMGSYQNLPYEEFLERNSSEYIYNMQSLSEQYFKQILQSILRIASEGLVIVAISLLLIWTNITAFSLLFILMGGALFTYDRWFRRGLNVYGASSNASSVQITRGIREGMLGIKETRILGKEKYFYSLVEKGALDYSAVNIKSQVIAAAPRYFLELIIIMFVVSITLVTMVIGENISSLLPTLAMFGVASIRVLPSINQIIGGIVQVRYGKDAIDILYKDVRHFKTANSDKVNLISTQENFQSISLMDVAFSYKGSDKEALSDISFTIERGEAIGIIGQSGEGKTTLIDIIIGLLKPTKGEIFYNNNPMLDHENDWISNVAYIPQQVLLLDDTLSKNITLVDESNSIDSEKLFSAINKARLTNLVKLLPDGLDTKLGDNGIRISGGQRQRVALARAFYHDRDVLILDEATSSLDKQTEKEIVDEIKRLRGRVTMIIVSHNMSTIEHCDRVYRIEAGGIFQEK